MSAGSDRGWHAAHVASFWYLGMRLSMTLRCISPCARSIRGPGGDSDALLQAAAHLYQLAGRVDLALAILLRLRRPDAFDFITQHGLLPLLRPPHIAGLVRIDEARS